MLGTKVAKETLKLRKKRFHELNIHKNEPKVICTQIAQKQKSKLTKLINCAKKKVDLLKKISEKV